MEKNLYIDASHPNETRVVLKSGESIEDYEYEGLKNNLIKNNIYLGKVSRVEPSLQAAFIDFGRDRHGFLSFNDIQSDYYQIPSEDKEKIDKQIVADMLSSALSDLRKISDAQPGDKTLIDCLVPAEQAMRDSITVGDSFNVALANMKKAAKKGKDLTKNMIAKKGRSSRLGERSRGTVDAGATSCFLLLESLADSILVLIG